MFFARASLSTAAYATASGIGRGKQTPSLLRSVLYVTPADLHAWGALAFILLQQVVVVSLCFMFYAMIAGGEPLFTGIVFHNTPCMKVGKRDSYFCDP